MRLITTESMSHVVSTLGIAESYLGQRGARPHESVFANRQRHKPRQCPAEKRGLVKTPLALSLRMQRNWSDDVNFLDGPGLREGRSQQGREQSHQVLSPVEFQGLNDTAQFGVVPAKRTRSRVWRMKQDAFAA